MTEEIELDDTDLMTLRKMAPRQTAGATIESRAKRERSAMRKPKQEKEVPLNVDVPPEVKQMVSRARSDHGIPMKKFVADAIRRAWAELDKGA